MICTAVDRIEIEGTSTVCFSTTASSGFGALLLAIGIMTLRMTYCPAERPHAAIPLLFMIRQFVEEVAWLGSGGSTRLSSIATQVYSFFSHVPWSAYAPLAAWLLEPRGPRHRGLLAFVVMGLVVGAYLLCNLAINPIQARPMAGYVDYQSPHLYIVASITSYLPSTAASLLLSNHVWVKVFEAPILAASFAIYIFCAHWFTSVWCFFAMLLSDAAALHFIALRSIPQQRIPS